MWAIAALFVALIVCLVSGGVEVQTSTRVKVGGKTIYGKRKDTGKSGDGDTEGADEALDKEG